MGLDRPAKMLIVSEICANCNDQSLADRKMQKKMSQG